MANLQKKPLLEFMWLRITLKINSSLQKILLTLAIWVQAIFASVAYEFDARYGFGASELTYNSVPGFAVSIYPIKNFGISYGLEYSWRWQTKTSAPHGENPPVLDSENDTLIFKYAVGELREKFAGKILQMPLMLKYTNDSYYAALGAKIGFVKNANANVSYSGLETEGYYPQYKGPLTEPLFQGFGPQEDASFKTKISSKTLFMLAFEGGLRFILNDYFALSTGIFADYSLNKGFNRTQHTIIERVESKNGADIVANDSWKKWRPWSVGLMVKISLLVEPKPPEPQDSPIPNEPPPPSPAPPPPPVAEIDSFSIESLLYREPDFVFLYPETRTNESDSLHQALISQIADTLRAKPSRLHCIGYSEALLSESVAYETALQRAINIRDILTRFYGLEENRFFIYSQGSKGSEIPDRFRKIDCFVE
jgi:hypothetical protein